MGRERRGRDGEGEEEKRTGEDRGKNGEGYLREWGMLLKTALCKMLLSSRKHLLRTTRSATICTRAHTHTYLHFGSNLL